MCELENVNAWKLEHIELTLVHLHSLNIYFERRCRAKYIINNEIDVSDFS